MSFRFKQFFVNDDRCAMKVGTDGVLLGAYAPLPDWSSHVLDIGTGCGLVALMMAQKYPNAQIDAIDIDEAAAEQAQENFQASPWSDRLHAYASRLQDWQPNEKYDVIVSNPPYFQNSLKNPDKARQTARHTDTLSFDDLIIHCTRLLKEDGVLAIILPAEAGRDMRNIVDKHALPAKFSTSGGRALCHTCSVFVRSKEDKPNKRVIMFFDMTDGHSIPQWVYNDLLVLEDENGGRSAAYKELTKDFYL